MSSTQRKRTLKLCFSFLTINGFKNTSLILFITIFLSLFLQFPCQVVKSPSPSPTPTSKLPPLPPLVKNLCAKTAASEPFCIKTFESDKRSWEGKNFLDLTKIFLSIGVKNAKDSANFIGGLAKKKGVTPKFIEALENCADRYNSISLRFTRALDEVEDGDYNFSNYDIMLSMDDIKICQHYLSDAKLSIKAISDAFDVTNYFINIGATFTDILLFG